MESKTEVTTTANDKLSAQSDVASYSSKNKKSIVNNEHSAQRKDDDNDSHNMTLIAKWGKKRIKLENLPYKTTTIAQVKEMLEQQTHVLPKRQKLIGLMKKNTNDDHTLQQCLGGFTVPKEKNFVFMGTPEADIFVDPSEKSDLPVVVQDLDWDFPAGSEEWTHHVANEENLKKFTKSTQIYVINQPRQGLPLLVLDLDHTLLDFSAKTIQRSTTTTIAQTMKRPHMDEFLTRVYPYYDIVIWSQTSWRWLETKLTELNMLTHAGYKIAFCLDKTSMFQITSTTRTKKRVHFVKPLEIIWNQFPTQWGPHNTVHLDDLGRNFALNPDNGLRVTPFYRKKAGQQDAELLGLGRYLQLLATSNFDFTSVNFGLWADVVADKFPIKGEPLKK